MTQTIDRLDEGLATQAKASAPSTTLGSTALRPWLLVVVSLTLVAAVYSQTLAAPFLWDDRPLLEADAVQHLRAPWRYLTLPFWDRSSEAHGAGMFYGPIVVLSFALDHALHGDNAAGYHLTNLVLHLSCVGLVYLLGRRYGAGAAGAAFTATLWGLAPRLTEAVAWISGRTDELFALFALAAWLCYRPGNTRRLLGASALALGAAFSKESGLSAVLALVAAELWTAPRARKLLRLLPLVVGMAAYVALRRQVLAIDAAPAVAIPLTFLERILTIMEALGRYAWMVVDPWHPASQLGVIKVPSFGFVGLAVLVIVATTWGAVRFRRDLSRLDPIPLLLGLTPLLLVLHVVPMPWLYIAADRVLYVPLACLAVVSAVRVDRILRRRWIPLSASVVVASFGVTTAARASDYSDQLEFWIRAAETTPRSNWGPTLNLADEFSRAGLFEEALAIIQVVKSRQDPSGVQTSVQHELTPLIGLERYPEAESLIEHAASDLAKGPRLIALAQSKARLGRVHEARTLARTAQREVPSMVETGALLRQLDRADRHREALQSGRLTGVERQVEQAQLEMRLGRVSSASRAWLPFLDNPNLPPELASEAVTFFITFAERTALRKAVSRYRQRVDAIPALLSAYEDRERAAEKLLNFRPRIEAAIGLN